jgi:hypothetical protein
MDVPINLIISDSSKKKYPIRIVEKENNTFMCYSDLGRAIGLPNYSFSLKFPKCIVLRTTDPYPVKYISTDLILKDMEELKKICANKLALLAIEEYIKNIPSQKTGKIKENTKIPIINENTNPPILKSDTIPLVDLEDSSEDESETSSSEEMSCEDDTESSTYEDSKIEKKQMKNINELHFERESENKKNEISQKYNTKTINIKQEYVKKCNNLLFMNEDEIPIRFVYAKNIVWINVQDLFKFIEIPQPNRYIQKYNINFVRMEFDGASRNMISFEESKNLVEKLKYHFRSNARRREIIIDTVISTFDLIDRTPEEIEKSQKNYRPAIKKSKKSFLISDTEISSKNEDQLNKIPKKKSKIENDSDLSESESESESDLGQEEEQEISKKEFEKRMNFFLYLWTDISYKTKKKIYDEMKYAIIKHS